MVNFSNLQKNIKKHITPERLWHLW